MGKIYSFDVYDTVVTRLVYKPTDVFHLVAKSICNGSNFSRRVSSCFYSARIWSEFKARRVSEKEDISLEEIYRQLSKTLRLSNAQSNELLQLELYFEKLVTVAVTPVVSEIKRLKSKGEKIVFASDMYLPMEFLVDLLCYLGIADTDDRVYVSGEIGFTKTSGRLFDFVILQEGVKAVDLVHLGDNIHSDIIVPLGKGIIVPQVSFSVKPYVVRKIISFFDLSKYALKVLSARLHLEIARYA